jgi:hypothetical protein
MANPKASSVAPLTPIASPGTIASNLEQTSEQTREEKRTARDALAG